MHDTESSCTSLNGDGDAEYRTQAVITLVHGTWGRGFFPKLQLSAKPRWFEPGSLFRERLKAELVSRGVAVKFSTFLWSGANSLRHRDAAAQMLTNRLLQEYSEHPDTDQIIIAHSHGGNISLRALRNFRAEVSRPRLCTLATPFLQVFDRTMTVYEKVSLFCYFPYIFMGGYLFLIGDFTSDLIDIAYSEGNVFKVYFSKIALIILGAISNNLPAMIFVTLLATIIPMYLANGPRLVYSKNTVSSKFVGLSAQPSLNQNDDVLVLRSVDDEPSLLIAIGSSINRLTILISRLIIPTFLVAFFSDYVIFFFSSKEFDNTLELWFHERYGIVYSYLLFPSTILFMSALLLRGLYGRELIFTGPAVQINLQSSPDSKNSSTIVTLVERETSRIGTLRHYIYEHRDVCSTIADWVARHPK